MSTEESDELVRKIKSRGYWRVNLRPSKFEKERISSLADCANLVRECEVRLRGWYYPHYGKYEPMSGLDWVESRVDWADYKGIWRMYQSGQFIHLFGCKEDWLEEDVKVFGPPRFEIPPPKTILDVFNTLYTLTEIYEFTSRLAQKNLFDTGLYLSIELHGMKNRKLVILNRQRFPLFEDYICQILDDMPRSFTLQAGEIISRGSELALQHAIWVYERFNWRKPSIEVLKDAQNKLLEHRL